MAKRGKMKNVYVVKSTPPDVDEKHRELSTKNVYLLKSDTETLERYQDLVYDFTEEKDGLFLLITQDKTFFQNTRKSLTKDLDIDIERLRLVNSIRRAKEEIRVYTEYQKKPFIFVESDLNGRSSLPFIEELKADHSDLFAIVLMSDVDEKLIAQFVEAGVDNFITKPVSTNVLVEKIANTLEPPDEVGRMVREGKRRLKKVEFALAYGVARDILQKKPGSPAALMIMGDALKGLCKRNDALKMYQTAYENAPMYLEPLKKIVEFHKEDGNREEALEYLVKIDELSPMHLGRKKEIGELYFMKGKLEEAARYYFEAVKLSHGFKQPECVRLAQDYADKIFNVDPMVATKLLEITTKLASIYRVDMDWSIYNRLGMVLRRQKRWRPAVEAYHEAAARSPKDESIFFNMGMAYVEGRDYGSAAENFERAMKINPSFYHGKLAAAYTMGQVFIRANRPANAKIVLSHVQAEDPNYKKVGPLLQSLNK